jgi:VIT1/CCC1 family predicted Fe2+/Mn2+ transporter
VSSAAPAADQPSAPPPGRLKRILKRLWWFHSFFALAFGIGVMLFARSGLAHADKVMMALFVSWLLMFVALRFIVGPANRREQEGLARKGVRVATNYLIKQFYQQMFFFLTPLYASSATWSLSSFNWWIAPVLLVCAVVSTMDLVFDNFIMERRLLAAAMYGLAMFGVLNVLLPLVVGLDHLTGLYVAALATPISVALLSFSVRQVMSPQGALITLVMTGALFVAVFVGRQLIPPAPLAMPETTVGHGTRSSYECLPASKHAMRAHQLDNLRCGSMLREPGGLKERVEHAWRHRGRELARITPEQLACDGDDVVFVSEFPKGSMPADPTGMWSCTTYTVGGQLVGVRKFEVLTKEGASIETPPGDAGTPDAVPTDAPPPVDAGAPRD